MYLKHLSLTNFRNFTRLDIDVPQGALILVGENAQGKTSLMEAVYYLSSFTSFQAENDRQLINFISSREPLAVARLVAEYQAGEESHQLEVRLIQEVNDYNGNPRLRKEILLDGVKRKSSEVVGCFKAVLFLPQMLEVVVGAPEDRRRFINLALTQIIPRYATALGDYNTALTQRNALLKQLGERGGDPAQLNYWDEQLSISGAVLIYHRIQSIQELDHIAAPIHRELTHGNEILRLSYEPSFEPMPKPEGQFLLPVNASIDRTGLILGQIQRGFLERLLCLREEEINRGVTTTGPHRDELRFLTNGIDLGTYGSRGQVRSMMLALKLAEMYWMKGKCDHWPVLLLDEVLAELDNQRRSDLLSHIVSCKQVFLTTTDKDLFTNEFLNNARIWRVKEGQIVPERS